jgi:hypothetical protein
MKCPQSSSYNDNTATARNHTPTPDKVRQERRKKDIKKHPTRSRFRSNVLRYWSQSNPKKERKKKQTQAKTKATPPSQPFCYAKAMPPH